MKSRPTIRADRGAITLFTLAVAPGMFYMIGLAYDEGLRFDVHQTANSMAREAARMEAQCVDVGAYLATGVPQVLDPAVADPTKGSTCAQPYFDAISPSLTSSGITFSFHVKIGLSGGLPANEVEVDVTLTRPTIFLAGFTNTSTGNATVKLTQGVIDAGG
jgi:hypothetical protein